MLHTGRVLADSSLGIFFSHILIRVNMRSDKITYYDPLQEGVHAHIAASLKYLYKE